jgi:hypothetical protein
MSTHRSGRFDRHAAQQILRGEAPRSRDGEEKLGNLLAAAAAPARVHELNGEQAALAAFRAAHRAGSQPRTRSLLKDLLARHLPAKVAAAAAAVVALGGVAAAAVTGTLPAVFGGGGDGPPASSVITAPSTASRANPGNGPDGSPAVAGLCRAYASAPRADHDRALDNPTFGPLVQAAGSKAQVPGYCAHLPANNPAGPKNDAPSGNGSAGHPNAPPPATHGDQPLPSTPTTPLDSTAPALPPPGPAVPSSGTGGGGSRGGP